MVRKGCPTFNLGIFPLIIMTFFCTSPLIALSYQKAIAQVMDDAFEIQNGIENDKYQNARFIDPGEYIGLKCQDDDWYKVNVPSLGKIIEANLKVTIQFFHGHGDLDLNLYSANSSPNDYNFLSISGLTTNEEVVSASVSPGDYLIRVYGYRGVKNEYKMNIEILYACQYVPYGWMDISYGEQDIPLADDDHQEIEIGFDFKFYGQVYNTVKVSSNGYLTFAEQTNPSFNPFSPTPISATHSNAPPESIFSYWMNLRPDLGGGVFYKLDQSNPNCKKLIVEWRDVPRDFTGEGVTFQAVLFECTNQILLQYKDVMFSSQNDGYSLGNGATVGVVNSKKTSNSLNRIATQYLYKEPILKEQVALMFTPSLYEPLRILSSNLIDGDIQVPHLDQQINILFSQYIDGNALNGSFSIDPFVNGEWVLNQNRITFNHPGDPFTRGSSYKVTLSTDLIRDCFGNTLLGDTDYTFTFDANSPDTNQPDIEISPSSLTFGNVVVKETSDISVINISNKGNADLSILSLSLSDKVNFFYDETGGSNPLGNPPATIPVGENRTIIIAFTPSVEETLNAIIKITSDDQDTPIIDISIHGKGITIPVGWTTYDLENCFGTGDCLTSPVITAFMLDANETLWIGSAPYETSNIIEGGGVCAYNLHTGALSCFDEDNGLAGNNIIDIASGPKGELWVATDIDTYGHGAGVSRFVGEGMFESYDPNQMGINDDLWITDIVVDSNSHLWVATILSGLFEFDGLDWNHYKSTGDNITSLEIDSSGRLWIGTLYNDLFVKEPFGTPTRINLNLGDYISEIAIDPNGNLWIVSILDNENSLIFLNPDELLPIYISIPDSLTNSDINNLFFDPITGKLFIAGNDGFYEYNGQNWNHFDLMNSGIPSLSVNSIVADPFNDYWVGTEEGISHFNSALPYIVGGIYSDTDGSDNLPIDTNIFIRFSEPMDRISTEMAFEMTNQKNGKIVNGSFNWNKNSTVIKFNPVSSLSNNILYDIKIFKDARDRAGMTIDLNVCEGVDFCLYTISTEAEPKPKKETPTAKTRELYTLFSNYYWPNYYLYNRTGYFTGINGLRISTNNVNLPFKVDLYSSYQFMKFPRVESFSYTNYNTHNLFSPVFYTTSKYQAYGTSLQGLNNYPYLYQYH